MRESSGCPHRRLPGSEPCPYCEAGIQPPAGYVDPTTPREYELRKRLRILLMDFEKVWPGMKTKWGKRKGACLAWYLGRRLDGHLDQLVS